MRDDDAHMGRALALARSGLATTTPNPSVGAVIVKEGQIIGQGHTQPVGGPHAEVVALADAAARGQDLRGATLYVTLEPCCHFGRTGPCTAAILAAGLARVVVAIPDPNPLMQGKGLALLRDAGLTVELGVEAEAASALVVGFSRAITFGLPEVTAKIATSLDGHLATAQGESKWISGEAARAHAHRLRAEHDAILVGIGTVLADDPALTNRSGEGGQPRPVVLDSGLRIPENAAIFGHPRRPVVYCGPDAPERTLAADVVRVGSGPRGLDLEAVLRDLVARHHHRILVEGGAKVHRALFEGRWVDHLVVYLAAVLVPGGRSWLGGPPVDSLSEATRLGAPSVESLGPDLALRYPVAHRVPVG
jgi:diaminohydroxyphosphoribosylaminopyrimidine deaminase/5-amino-6-(5-phosphoribosylamino)uracil reductase